MASDVLARLGRLGLGPRQLLLAAILWVSLGLAAPVALMVNGWAGVAHALLSMIVCWISAALALVFSHLFRGPALAVPGVFLAMMVRMGLPLAVLVLIHLGGGLWSRVGIIYYFIFFYLITLIVETGMALLSLRTQLIPPRPASSDSPTATPGGR